MRLKESEISSIKLAARAAFGEDVKVYLFGSRVYDNLKGGDIDLYIEINDQKDTFARKLKMRRFLEKALGERKIDIIINSFQSEKYIFKVAKEEGILL